MSNAATLGALIPTALAILTWIILVERRLTRLETQVKDIKEDLQRCLQILVDPTP